MFKHTEVLPCPGVNVFIGKNGVGKTQLMKAIYAKMMSDKDKNRLLAEYFKRGGTSYELNSSLGTQPASIQIEKSTADNKAVFLPVKDMLTHAKGLLSMEDKYREFPFDRTLTDVILPSLWKECIGVWRFSEGLYGFPKMLVDRKNKTVLY